MSWQNELFSSYILTIIHSLENNNNWTENGGGPDRYNSDKDSIWSICILFEIIPKRKFNGYSLRDLWGQSQTIIIDCLNTKKNLILPELCNWCTSLYRKKLYPHYCYITGLAILSHFTFVQDLFKFSARDPIGHLKVANSNSSPR